MSKQTEFFLRMKTRFVAKTRNGGIDGTRTRNRVMLNPSRRKGFRLWAEDIDSDIDSLFWQRPSDADSNCPKMGQSQRRVKEGGFEGGGVVIF